MTTAQAVAIVAARLHAHAVDRDTATMQVQVILDQYANGDAAGTVLDIAVALVEARAHASKLSRCNAQK
jgi:hypothetical protein